MSLGFHNSQKILNVQNTHEIPTHYSFSEKYRGNLGATNTLPEANVFSKMGMLLQPLISFMAATSYWKVYSDRATVWQQDI